MTTKRNSATNIHESAINISRIPTPTMVHFPDLASDAENGRRGLVSKRNGTWISKEVIFHIFPTGLFGYLPD